MSRVPHSGWGSGTPGTEPRSRFIDLDSYRASREWVRYEGTPQRELFRDLRRRFLERHARRDGWAIDVGSGPGRFTPAIGSERANRVALDISWEMLAEMQRRWVANGSGIPNRVRGDAVLLPFKRRSASIVVALGNPLGFSGGDWEEALRGLADLTGAGGTLVVETAPAPGERSKYLGRLPVGAVGRLFSAPPRAILPRLRREGFVPESARHATGAGFQRIGEAALGQALREEGMTIVEALAVAPALGADPERVAAVHPNARSWERLLAAEEELGRDAERRARAAALLVAATRSGTPAGAPPSSER